MYVYRYNFSGHFFGTVPTFCFCDHFVSCLFQKSWQRRSRRRPKRHIFFSKSCSGGKAHIIFFDKLALLNYPETKGGVDTFKEKISLEMAVGIIFSLSILVATGALSFFSKNNIFILSGAATVVVCGFTVLAIKRIQRPSNEKSAEI
jgi:hypothetical protein